MSVFALINDIYPNFALLGNYFGGSAFEDFLELLLGYLPGCQLGIGCK